MKPYSHQVEGARFLAGRAFAILADAPRVGKTGASIMAADMILAGRILVVTTASGRAVWQRGFEDWSVLDRPVEIVTSKPPSSTHGTGVTIIGWGSVANERLRAALLKQRFDLIILDEQHYAKSFDAKRTVAALGQLVEDGGGSTAALAWRGWRRASGA